MIWKLHSRKYLRIESEKCFANREQLQLSFSVSPNVNRSEIVAVDRTHPRTVDIAKSRKQRTAGLQIAAAVAL